MNRPDVKNPFWPVIAFASTAGWAYGNSMAAIVRAVST